MMSIVRGLFCVRTNVVEVKQDTRNEVVDHINCAKAWANLEVREMLADREKVFASLAYLFSLAQLALGYFVRTSIFA